MSEKEKSEVLQKVREMLGEGQINPTDHWHANDLVNHTKFEDITPPQVGWLESLIKREGKPFRK